MKVHLPFSYDRRERFPPMADEDRAALYTGAVESVTAAMEQNSRSRPLFPVQSVDVPEPLGRRWRKERNRTATNFYEILTDRVGGRIVDAFARGPSPRRVARMLSLIVIMFVTIPTLVGMVTSNALALEVSAPREALVGSQMEVLILSADNMTAYNVTLYTPAGLVAMKVTGNLTNGTGRTVLNLREMPWGDYRLETEVWNATTSQVVQQRLKLEYTDLQRWNRDKDNRAAWGEYILVTMEGMGLQLNVFLISMVVMNAFTLAYILHRRRINENRRSWWELLKVWLYLRLNRSPIGKWFRAHYPDAVVRAMARKAELLLQADALTKTIPNTKAAAEELTEIAEELQDQQFIVDEYHTRQNVRHFKLKKGLAYRLKRGKLEELPTEPPPPGKPPTRTGATTNATALPTVPTVTPWGSKGEAWACGCRTWTEGEAFMYKPCQKPGCLIAPVVMEESKKRGQPVVFSEYRGSA